MPYYSYGLPEVESAVTCSEKGMEYWYTAVGSGTIYSRVSERPCTRGFQLTFSAPTRIGKAISDNNLLWRLVPNPSRQKRSDLEDCSRFQKCAKENFRLEYWIGLSHSPHPTAHYPFFSAGRCSAYHKNRVNYRSEIMIFDSA
jgi:hypothetical protein